MNYRKILNAIMMVTGTSVGSGILGLPIITSSAGFIPTIIAFSVAWIFMTVSAFYILDVKMQVRGSANLSTLIKATLGRPGQYIASIMIVLLLYALLCTYMMAGSAWLHVLVKPVAAISKQVTSIVLTLFLGTLLLASERLTYRFNNILGIGLLAAFVVTVASGMVPVHFDFIQRSDFQAVPPSLPLLLTTFGFSIVVPTLTQYLDYDVRSVKFAIIIGSLVALSAYVIWEWVTLGNISQAKFELMKQAGDNGTGVILSLAQGKQGAVIALAGRLFAIFAVVTSFLGVSLALLHFLSDNLMLELKGRNRLVLFGLVYLPPIIVTSFYPQAFVQILSFAGIFVAVLLGLLPAVMVWKQHQTRRWIVGGVVVFFVLVIIQEIINVMIPAAF